MIGDLKTMVLDQIKTMVTEQVIRAGIEWLIGLLGGPAGAFIKAVQGIVRVVSWIIENGSRIAALVNAVLGSLEQIAAGNVGGAAAYIERTLAQALPLVISFLANLLGLGGISRKVQEIIERVKAPIDRAIQWIVQKATAMARRLLTAMRGRGRGRGGEGDGDLPTDPRQRAELERAGLAAIDTEEQRYNRSGEGLTRDEADRVAATVRHRHRVFTTLRVVDGGTTWNYEYALQRMSTKDGENKQSVNYKWGNPKSVPTYGHTFLDHGQKVTLTQLKDRARGLQHQIGQYLDDNHAAKVLADLAQTQQAGVYDVPIPEGLQTRLVLPDGTEIVADSLRIVIKDNGTIRTSYPFNSQHPH
jgi:hypothetical protein